MWKCPKCGNEFEKQNQSHSCDVSTHVIEDYIRLQPVDIQPLLIQIHRTVSNELPDVHQRISYGMPTYWHKHNIIHFAAFKSHIGLYPGPLAIEHFTDLLTEYKMSKGAIRFPYSKPIPLELIAEIAHWCYTTGNHH